MVAYVVSIFENGGCRGAREGGWKEGHCGCEGSFEEASKSGCPYLAITTPLGGQCKAVSNSKVHSSPCMLDNAL